MENQEPKEKKLDQLKKYLLVAYGGMICLIAALVMLVFLFVANSGESADISAALFRDTSTGSGGAQSLSTAADYQYDIIVLMFVMIVAALMVLVYLTGRFKTLNQQIANSTSGPDNGRSVMINQGPAIFEMNNDTVSYASHQMKTPLLAQKWLTESLLSGEYGGLNSKQLDVVDKIDKSTERMFDLVGMYLDSNKIRNGKAKLEYATVNLTETINEVIGELGPEIREKNIKVCLDATSGVSTLTTDKKLVRECLVGIISNAIKYSPDSGKVDIDLLNKNDEVVAKIADNGCGIPKSEQDKIFSKFFRASNASEMEPEGHGLGMYMVKEMAEAFGGRVWFSSEVNKGTTVWLSIPDHKTEHKQIAQ